MLIKNVYLLYPAGYAGNYLSWAINASDLDLCKNTVASPVNTTQSIQFGGIGTSHLHHRIPTHQSIKQHMPWMILNQPHDCRTYVINTNTKTLPDTISQILAYDRDPVFIVIHDHGDLDTRSYAHINCITKWPVWFAASSGSFGLELNFDPFNYAQDRNFRNVIATEQNIVTHMDPVDSTQMQRIKHKYKRYVDWYHARNLANPHEVNTDYYIARDRFPVESVFELSCLDIVSESLPDKLNNIMSKSQCSDKFDISQIANGHRDYLQNQKNLQWFDSVHHWKQTGLLDEYLMSHAGIQGQILFRILQDCDLINKDAVTGDNAEEQTRWQAWYYRIRGSDWPACDHEQDFYHLPDWVQQDLVQNYNYQPSIMKEPARAECRLALANWKNLPTDKINSIYQSFKSQFTLV